jgi:drug/metabolite transporter (DMT)-like permease
MFVAALLLLSAALCLEGPFPTIDAAGAMSLVYVGPCATGFAYWAMVQVGRHFSPSTLSMSLLAVPALGILASSIALGETVDSALVGGGILIAVGIGLTATR